MLPEKINVMKAFEILLAYMAVQILSSSDMLGIE